LDASFALQQHDELEVRLRMAQEQAEEDAQVIRGSHPVLLTPSDSPHLLLALWLDGSFLQICPRCFV
jgi:hypothetical protein